MDIKKASKIKRLLRRKKIKQIDISRIFGYKNIHSVALFLCLKFKSDTLERYFDHLLWMHRRKYKKKCESLVVSEPDHNT
jgi:hypothetical protein